MAGEQGSKLPILRFAQFFKSYGIGLGLVLAAIPFATSRLDLLPGYEANKNILTFFTSLVSLLGVAFLFAIRRVIGDAVYPRARVLSPRQMRWRHLFGVYIPLGLIALSVAALALYLLVLNKSIDQAAIEHVSPAGGYPLSEIEPGEGREAIEAPLFGLDKDEALVRARGVLKDGGTRVWSVNFRSEKGIGIVLELTPSVDIPLHWWIEGSYVLMFFGAAMAFVWFGLAEYIQGERGVTDQDLLEDPYRLGTHREFGVPALGVLGEGDIPVFFTILYNPDKASSVALISGPDGPYCERHRRLMRYKGPGTNGGHEWACLKDTKDASVDKRATIEHTVRFEQNPAEMKRLAEEAAGAEMAWRSNLHRPAGLTGQAGGLTGTMAKMSASVFNRLARRK